MIRIFFEIRDYIFEIYIKVMARIAGVTLPKNKRIVIGLTAIYGIGKVTAEQILDAAGIDHSKRVHEITDAEETKLREIVTKTHRVEGDLRREVLANIKRLKEIKTYRGARHSNKLPARGQRTKTNARTKRGKKQTAGSGKKKAAAKT